ncbi:ScyD/ScyE family protein [Symbioplanes lichenis]|uniref:ScyD/ScyE family protein n=1 Tax=Symbioplanes lichenis TaxID=1629072 RepID=UPI002738CACC|nr:ScyD/ScyE family protein [Actinoplanes lichenis]
MRSRARATVAVGASVLVMLPGFPAQASAGSATAPVRTITKGLDGPYGLDFLSPRTAVVAEGDTGEVTTVDLKTGKQRTIISGLAGPSGVATHNGRIYVQLGGEPVPGAKYPAGALLVADRTGKHVRVLADLMAYELKHNPDGQKQFDDKQQPYDALSNPFSITWTKWGLLVADGGANDVLRVNPRTGKVSTFFVPPNPRTKECLAAGAQANPGTVGCDSVPTGVAVRGRYVYVSTLGAEQPGAAVIYQLDGHTGRVVHKWKGFTSLTGIAVAPHGTIYTSEVLFNAPPGEEPPPGFDPSTVGRLTRLDHGRVTHAAVTMPTGLRYVNGHLYATSWSIASFLRIPKAGQLVDVSRKAFR